MRSRSLKRLRTAAAAAILLSAPLAAHADLEISPSTFDFGWAPDNSKISATFVVKNTGRDMVPLTGVQPTCGCTASNFEPGALESMEETKIELTFNTRGYGGMEFNKSTRVKTDNIDQEYTVFLKGHVTNPKAPVLPLGGGIAAFEPGSASGKKSIKLKNTVNKDLGIEIIQQPASWAAAKLSTKKLKASGTATVDISVEGPYDTAKDTSVTLLITGGDAEHRLTLAIRTGPPPPSPRVAPPPSTTNPETDPSPQP